MLDLLLIIRSCIESVGGQREVQEVCKTSGHIESFVLSSVFGGANAERSGDYLDLVDL